MLENGNSFFPRRPSLAGAGEDSLEGLKMSNLGGFCPHLGTDIATGTPSQRRPKNPTSAEILGLLSAIKSDLGQILALVLSAPRTDLCQSLWGSCANGIL